MEEDYMGPLMTPEDIVECRERQQRERLLEHFKPEITKALERLRDNKWRGCRNLSCATITHQKKWYGGTKRVIQYSTHACYPLTNDATAESQKKFPDTAFIASDGRIVLPCVYMPLGAEEPEGLYVLHELEELSTEEIERFCSLVSNVP